MTTDSNGAEPQDDEPAVDLFARDFDDKSLLGEEAEPIAEANTDESDSVKPVEETDLPEKYQGKSLKEVVEMHQNLERAYGRHNNELGELRKLTDELLQQKLSGKDAAKEEDVLDADALLENPDAVLRNRIENNPRLRELEARLEARERAEQQRAFDKAFPDAKAVINDPRWQKWIDASPTRQRLLAQADQSYDFEMLGELMTLFGAATGSASEERVAETKQAMSGAKPSTGSKGGKKKPVFTKKQLARLQIEDPRRYDALQDVIMEAYVDGRVR